MNVCDPQEASGADFASRRCAEWLNGSIAPEELWAKQISGGITNVLYRVQIRPEVRPEVVKRCSARGVVLPEGFRSNGVGVRFYGPSGHCEVVDREEEALVTAAAAAICKKTHYRFEGGQIDEWLIGRHIEFQECVDPAYRDAMAAHLARFHLVPYLGHEDLDEASHTVVRRLRYWLTKLAGDASSYLPPAGKELNQTFLKDFDLFEEAYAYIETSPVAQEVLCHNDLLTGNIILTPASSRGSKVGSADLSIEFIDYEYASKGWNVYDLANHLVETASSDWSASHDPAYVRAFVSTYLDYVGGVKEKYAQRTATTASSPRDVDEECGDTNSSTSPGSHASSEMSRPDELDETLRMIEFCAPLTHFYWGVWALAQLVNTVSLNCHRQPQAAICDFLKFSSTRAERWHATRPHLLQYLTRM